LSNFVTYYNALQAYIHNGEAAVVGVVNSVENTVEGFIGNNTEAIANDISQASTIIQEGAALILDNVNVTGVVNFTQFWKADFDLESVTIGEILADISIGSNIVSQAEAWFTSFFASGDIEALLG